MSDPAANATTLVRCPMRECRRRIDLTSLPSALGPVDPPPCLHFIAAWSPGRSSMAVEVFWALSGNREFFIRNIRPADFDAARVDAIAAVIDEAVRQFATVVDEVAVFGDQYERDTLARLIAQALIGPDPMVYRAAGA